MLRDDDDAEADNEDAAVGVFNTSPASLHDKVGTVISHRNVTEPGCNIAVPRCIKTRGVSRIS